MAAQGPLPNTCTHFWRSVWEQGVSVIIMLTTLTERGRVGSIKKKKKGMRGIIKHVYIDPTLQAYTQLH